ncbi:carbohydrate-binding module family 24 protein [Penicillium canariense]|uniref:Carbohydrate-binding module family 24 protein n=1 Tax=Penicillium canariense TaxID=189055 RepID=A0A9W9LKT3_9EURO|nr:carbohydrate-binding module family 24 protein [Penicillium canariense]KAJ5160953.1 carbohydrate-binding module family 24 protein [Penicillium canariense]
MWIGPLLAFAATAATGDTVPFIIAHALPRGLSTYHRLPTRLSTLCQPSAAILDSASWRASGDIAQVLHADNTNVDLGCSSDDGSDPDCAKSSPCDFTKKFSTLDELAAALDTLAPVCVDYYTINGLQTVLQETLVNYTDITNSYDDKFNDYVKYVEEMIPIQWQGLMSSDEPYGPGSQFFQCAYYQSSHNKSTSSCPGDIGIMSGNYTVYYELINSTRFNDSVTSDYGIDTSWIEICSSLNDLDCTPGMDETGCLALHSTYTYKGLPVKAPHSAIRIANPKKIMTQAMPNVQNIKGRLYTARIQLALGAWPGTTDDLVQSLSAAVFMLNQSVASMQNVVDVAYSYEEAKKKEMINEILTGVLLLVPFLGELDAISDVFVGLSRLISMTGDVGLGASTVYAIVENPNMSPLLILETLVFSGMRSPDSFVSMGKARRGMRKDDIKGLGSNFAALDEKFQNIVAKCLAT